MRQTSLVFLLSVSLSSIIKNVPYCSILSVKDVEGWRPSEKERESRRERVRENVRERGRESEGYGGQNLAAPLLQDVKVGQSVPWMISNSTFWGPLH